MNPTNGIWYLVIADSLQGYYYIHNGILDDSKLPPHIPRGSYKVTLHLYSNNEFVAELYVVGEVVDKNK